MSSEEDQIDALFNYYQKVDEDLERSLEELGAKWTIFNENKEAMMKKFQKDNPAYEKDKYGVRAGEIDRRKDEKRWERK